MWDLALLLTCMCLWDSICLGWVMRGHRVKVRKFVRCDVLRKCLNWRICKLYMSTVPCIGVRPKTDWPSLMVLTRNIKIASRPSRVKTVWTKQLKTYSCSISICAFITERSAMIQHYTVHTLARLLRDRLDGLSCVFVANHYSCFQKMFMNITTHTLAYPETFCLSN